MEALNVTVAAHQLDEDEAHLLRKLVNAPLKRVMTIDPCVGAGSVRVIPDPVDPSLGFTLEVQIKFNSSWGKPFAVNQSIDDVKGTMVWNKFIKLVDAK